MGRTSKFYSSNFSKFRENRALSSLHQTDYFVSDALLPREKRATQRRVVSKLETKFNTFNPCKN